jgi:hypothetical protein
LVQDASGDPRERGQAIAEAFVAQLHPSLEFRFETGALSATNGVYSAHLIQRHNKRDVVTGVINVNIDVATGVVLSYGDAAHLDPGHRTASSQRCQGLQDKLDGLDKGAGQQIVLGAPVLSASNGVRAELDACLAERPVDPRAALVAFLVPIRSATGVHAISPGVDIDAIVEQMVIEHPLHGSGAENRVRIHNVPGAEEPVDARLAYIEHEGELKLVWSFIYRSADNWCARL